jgi:hypothetical protein
VHGVSGLLATGSVLISNLSPINLKNSTFAAARKTRQLTATLETYADAEPVSSADLLEHLQDLWILGLETAVHGYIFRRVFAKKDQRVAYVVGIIDCSRDFLHHLFLSFGLNARKGFDKTQPA